MKRKILYISGSRADYGLMRQTLLSIREHPNLEVEIGATGMHLMPAFGRTIKEIRKDKFLIHQIGAVYERDDKESMANFVGEFVLRLVRRIRYIKPDIILVLGDRAEMLAAAIVGTYLTIPVVHIHGGEVSSTVDDVVRHAITKLSHIHLTATKKSARRIIKTGEEKWRVFVVGAPGIDGILNARLFSKREISKRYHLNLSKPIILVIQHPVTEEIRESAKQMQETMEAIKKLSYQTIVVYPNADAGGRAMIKVVERYRRYPFIQVFKSIPHKDYLSLMRVASVMVGNSSSGIIEAPSVHLPVINIGTRQHNRERAKHIVIDVDYDKDQIRRSIVKAVFDKKFRLKIKRCRNPYRNGNASLKIVRILNKIEINKRLLKKSLVY